MLSLSKRTDYALLALSYLARVESGRAVNTKEVADQYDIPLELLAKILQTLTRAGMLISTAGPTGGYRLARAPKAISVGSVVALLDGAPALTPCLRIDLDSGKLADCEQIVKCTIRGPVARINTRIFEMLEHLSIAEISGEEDEENEALSSAPITFWPVPTLREEKTAHDFSPAGASPQP